MGNILVIVSLCAKHLTIMENILIVFLLRAKHLTIMENILVVFLLRAEHFTLNFMVKYSSCNYKELIKN